MLANSETPRMPAFRVETRPSHSLQAEVDLRVKTPADERLLDAAFALDSLEALPPFASQGIRQRVEIVRASRRILDLSERALLAEHQPGVASDATPEGRGRTQRFVKGRGRYEIGAPEDRREDLRRRTQHVHPGIALRERSRGADRVHERAGCIDGAGRDQHLRHATRSALSLHISPNVSRPAASRNVMRWLAAAGERLRRPTTRSTPCQLRASDLSKAESAPAS